MCKTVWILNHYAGNMFIVGGGRHYYLAKYLKEEGFNPVIFCSNFDHFSGNNCVDNDSLWIEKIEHKTNIPYVFIKTRKYSNNGIKRVLNMVDYYYGVMKTAKQYVKHKDFPDVIYASSVHPLTLLAGIRIAKRFGIRCISEVRDLWPESIIAYSSKWTRTNPIMRLLYLGEKKIYMKSFKIIMTWPGGYDYIKEQSWQKVIPDTKVIHISNGVDLESYSNNIQEHIYEDDDLSNRDFKNFIYTGSVRKVNNLSLLVAAARILKSIGNTTARILVFGDGDELDSLIEDTRDLNNIVFKGRVPKQNVPSILSQGYASILHNSSTELDKYGQSQNKFFEYLAAGRPILMTYTVGYSIINKFGCGMELDFQTPESIAQAIVSMCNLSEREYMSYCQNAVECSKRFDYKELCCQLVSVINQSITIEGEEKNDTL